MYEISPQLYLEIANALLSEIGTANFFSGSINLTHHDIFCKLICTVIVRRERTIEPEDSHPAVEQLCDVWWEFHTTEGGEELCNDFSFSTLQQYI